MGWVEVVLFVLFIVLPLLQGLLARGGKAGPVPLPSPPSAERSTEQAQVEQRDDAPELSAWDELFGSGTPAAADDETELEAVGLDTEPVEIVSLEPVEQLREVPESERFVAANVSPPLEQAQVDRRAEHNRFHDRYLAPEAPEPTQRPLATQLRGRDELRRAVVLTEVLGPPRSLQ